MAKLEEDTCSYEGASLSVIRSPARPQGCEIASLIRSDCTENYNRLMKIWVFTA